MQDKSKIRAFTLSEMVVVLILTSVLVGLAFSVLSLVHKHITSIQNNFNKNTELDMLQQTLWLDFNRYSKIEYNAIEDQLKFSNEMDSLRYQFHETYIVRDQDTLQVQLYGKTVFFDGSIVETGYVDAIRLETSETFQSQQLFVFKDNDATLFMN